MKINKNDVILGIHALSKHNFTLSVHTPQFMVDIWQIVLFQSDWVFLKYIKSCHSVFEFGFFMNEIESSSLSKYSKIVNACAGAVILARRDKIDKNCLLETIFTRLEL